jgi:hypothetical protein
MIAVLRHPTWPLRLSNVDLYEQLAAALDAFYEAGGPEAGPEPGRLAILHEELLRRERSGVWTEKDWEA